jgi:hypothetical protein
MFTSYCIIVAVAHAISEAQSAVAMARELLYEGRGLEPDLALILAARSQVSNEKGEAFTPHPPFGLTQQRAPVLYRSGDAQWYEPAAAVTPHRDLRRASEVAFPLLRTCSCLMCDLRG